MLKIIIIIQEVLYFSSLQFSVINEKHLCHLCLKKIWKDKPPELLAWMEMEILFFVRVQDGRKKRLQWTAGPIFLRS